MGAHHGPDAFVVEGQRERRAREAAAVEVCLQCPVMVACDRYANSVTSDGKLAQPEGVWGGRRGLERRRAFDRTRPVVQDDAVVDSVRKLCTPQKRAVLGALAVCWEPAEVMVRAGLPDVRTANWQRSAITRLLGLSKSASRMQVLEAAAGRGLLDGVSVVADDGSVPAVPLATEDVLAEVAGQVLLWPARRAEVQGAHHHRAGRGVWRAPSLRRKFTAVVGQEGLPLAGPVDDLPGVAEVLPLLAPALLEAAA
ncbi:MAG: hypothetical protein HOY75_08370 [Streptomyces sp.]|nr:hypothetical protein [Streptomyces sp.]